MSDARALRQEARRHEPAAPTDARPRVRHQARDALAVMAFSAVTATGLALALLVVTSLGR